MSFFCPNRLEPLALDEQPEPQGPLHLTDDLQVGAGPSGRREALRRREPS
jgi:hypothetical protein